MEHTIPHTLSDCFTILDNVVDPDVKAALRHTTPFEARYAFHSSLTGWISHNLIMRYNLMATDLFDELDLSELMLLQSPDYLAQRLVSAYRNHLLSHNCLQA